MSGVLAATDKVTDAVALPAEFVAVIVYGVDIEKTEGVPLITQVV
jgi:hypothetical protein